MKKRDVIREIETIAGCKWQVAKAIHALAELPAGSVRMIGPRVRGGRSPMAQENAAALVDVARKRIAAADEGETSEPGR